MEERAEKLEITWTAIAKSTGLGIDTLNRAKRNIGPMRPTNRRKLERALWWGPRSIDKILAGGEPDLLEHPFDAVTPVEEVDWKNIKDDMAMAEFRTGVDRLLRELRRNLLDDDEEEDRRAS